MRYALISDIHANLQAWKAVLIDIRSLGADQIICLGDIVGYGPNPSEVLQEVHSHVEHFILGNHDAVACGKMSSADFHDEARKIIDWTSKQINEKAKSFLRAMPLTLAGPSFRCAHGDFAAPGSFNYIIEPAEAMASWNAVPDQMLFVGHTHEPTIHVLGKSGNPHLIKPQNFQVEEGKRYIINVGSVGQPRDRDARACYCIYDTSSNMVFWRRIPFDIDAFRKSLHEAGLSEKPSYFLRADPRKELPPIREIVNFAPAATPDKAVKDAIQVQQLTTLKRRVKTWKVLSGIALAAGLAATSFAGHAWWTYKNRSAVIVTPTAASITAAIFPASTNMLALPLTSTPAGAPIPDWVVKLGDKTQQSARFDKENQEGKVFRLSSSTKKDEVSLISPIIKAGPGKKMCFEALFRKTPSFSGTIVASVSVIRKNNGSEDLLDPYVTKAPNQIRQGSWVLAKQTFELPANTISMRLHIHGNFTGEVLVKDISLENKE